MKRLFLLIAVSALLVTLGFAQTPTAGSNTDPANVKGCLGGSDGSYTVVEDSSRQIFKITTSSVDLKPHVGHDVKLTGRRVSGQVSSGAADNSFAVTELSMISEHCAAAAAATVGAVVPYSQTVIEPTTATPAPSAPASIPAVDAATPAATVSPSAAPVSTPAVEAAAPAATVSPSPTIVATPAVEAAAPAATVSPSPTTVGTPAVEAAAPAATVSPSTAPVSTPAANVAHPTRPSAHSRRLSAAQAAAAAPAATVSPAADAATASPAAADAATAGPASAPVSTPDAAATTPTVTHRTGSLALLISFVVLVIVLGTLVPLLGRWRKRKMLERTGTPNLSFTKKASSDQDKAEPRKAA
jgi:ribonuclease E